MPERDKDLDAAQLTLPAWVVDSTGKCVLTREQLEHAAELGAKLVSQLPRVDALHLCDMVAGLSEGHARYLMGEEGACELERVHRVASQLLWWNVLLISKLREVAVGELRGRIIVPGSAEDAG
jgi:hypothetical protein